MEGKNVGREIRKAVCKLLLFRDKGPSYSQPGLIDIQQLDCANRGGREVANLPYRLLKTDEL